MRKTEAFWLQAAGRDGTAWAAYLLVLFFVPGVASAGWPRVVEPPASTVEQIGGNVAYNSVPMQIYVYTSKLSPERVLAFYRDRWSDGFVENAYEGWRQISRLEDEYFITVQVGPGEGRGTRGRISIMHLHERPVDNPGAGVPKLQGTVVMNDTVSSDPGRKNRTVAMINTYSVESNADYYRRHYLERGWSTTLKQDMGGNHMTVYRKGTDEVTVVINKGDGGSMIVINEVKASGFFAW